MNGTNLDPSFSLLLFVRGQDDGTAPIRPCGALGGVLNQAICDLAVLQTYFCYGDAQLGGEAIGRC